MSLAESELRRVAAALALEPTRQAELGQFFTPAPVAMFLAAMFDLRPGPASLLDPGAGVGQLAAAFADRWRLEGTGPLAVTAVERDESLHEALRQTLDQMPTPGELVSGDYLEWTQTSLFNAPGTFDYVIMNPPYAKLNKGSAHRRLVDAAGVEVTNLYAAFVAMSIRQLNPGGQLVAITPRSFMNGPYFKAFRRDLLRHVGLRQIHVYDSRDSAFADSAVLQENVIFHVERDHQPTDIKITSSLGPGDLSVRVRTVPVADVVNPGDPASFIHLIADDESAGVVRAVAAQPDTLASLDVAVSTGRVVDFRCRELLRPEWTDGDAPLLYPTHLRDGGVQWPKKTKKPNGLAVADATTKLLLPAGYYVLIKRFSSKEERRRIVASLLSPDDVSGDYVAIENHLNVIHRNQHGLDRDLALGLTAWLNSTSVDVAFRQFSGHTQVNATDLRSMRFPSSASLMALGRALADPTSEQEVIDRLVDEHVLSKRAA